MKANAPERIWIDPATDLPKLSGHIDKDSIEYTRTDAFIEKMARFLENKLYDRVEIQVFGTLIPSLTSKKSFIEEFTNYMKGE